MSLCEWKSRDLTICVWMEQVQIWSRSRCGEVQVQIWLFSLKRKHFSDSATGVRAVRPLSPACYQGWARLLGRDNPLDTAAKKGQDCLVEGEILVWGAEKL